MSFCHAGNGDFRSARHLLFLRVLLALVLLLLIFVFAFILLLDDNILVGIIRSGKRLDLSRHPAFFLWLVLLALSPDLQTQGKRDIDGDANKNYIPC